MNENILAKKFLIFFVCFQFSFSKENIPSSHSLHIFISLLRDIKYWLSNISVVKNVSAREICTKDEIESSSKRKKSISSESVKKKKSFHSHFVSAVQNNSYLHSQTKYKKKAKGLLACIWLHSFLTEHSIIHMKAARKKEKRRKIISFIHHWGISFSLSRSLTLVIILIRY